MTETQEGLDRFYWKHGACCAGCDHWRYLNALVGECYDTPGLAGTDRQTVIGIHGVSTTVASGHVLTTRDHRCGAFADGFPWQAMPLPYLKRIGAKV